MLLAITPPNICWKWNKQIFFFALGGRIKHNLGQIQQTTEVNWGQRTGQQYEFWASLLVSSGCSRTVMKLLNYSSEVWDKRRNHSLSLQPRSGLHIYIVKIFGHQIVFFHEIKLVYTKKNSFEYNTPRKAYSNAHISDGALKRRFVFHPSIQL